MIHDLLISPYVVQEIEQTPDPAELYLIRRRLRGAGPITISGRERADRMAAELKEGGAFGHRMIADLTHVAYAIMGQADALVSWDRRTLAREKVRKTVLVYCRGRSLEVPLIGLPEEIATWLGLKM